MVGVDTQVFHGFVHCGAAGAITGVGNASPREILRLIELCEMAATGDVPARRLALGTRSRHSRSFRLLMKVPIWFCTTST